MTVTMKKKVIIVPQKITVPIGRHKGVPVSTIGNTPIDAAAEVRKIGLIRRSAL